jgi:quercetin dioxygenase-like cupin family protein
MLRQRPGWSDAALTILRRGSIAGSVLAVGLGGGLMVSRAQAPTAAPRPAVKLLIENDRVRVREIVLPPGGSTGQHTHQVPELAYVFTEGTVKVSTPRAKPVIEQWPAGVARWRDAGVTHELTNAGDQPMRVLVIDVKDVKAASP